MATKFLSLSIAPKENKKKTVFTHALCQDNFKWDSPGFNPENWNNVLHLGIYNETTNESLFKAWDDDDPKEFVIYRGILGEEEYTSL